MRVHGSDAMCWYEHPCWPTGCVRPQKSAVCYMTLARYPDPRELTLCSRHYRIYISRD